MDPEAGLTDANEPLLARKRTAKAPRSGIIYSIAELLGGRSSTGNNASRRKGSWIVKGIMLLLVLSFLSSMMVMFVSLEHIAEDSSHHSHRFKSLINSDMRIAIEKDAKAAAAAAGKPVVTPSATKTEPKPAVTKTESEPAVTAETESPAKTDTEPQTTSETQDAPSTTVTTPTPVRTIVRADARRQQAVLDAFKHAWRGYNSKCFGQDEYRPLSKSCHNWLGAKLTMVDALSTMHVMGMKSEAARVTDHLISNLDFNKVKRRVSFFETTIRILGGLLSARDFETDSRRRSGLLGLARAVGEKLSGAFGTPSGMPTSEVDLATGARHNAGWVGGKSLLAEVGTIQLEFTTLAHATRENRFAEPVQRVIDHLQRQERGRGHPPGLLGIKINQHNGNVDPGSLISFGAMGDSYYEYLLKRFLLTKKDPKYNQYRDMYLTAMDSMLEHIVVNRAGRVFVADIRGGKKLMKMDHLACFVPGMLALGVHSNTVTDSVKREKHMEAARGLMDTCIAMYDSQPSGIGAEYSVFDGPQTNANTVMRPGHDSSYKLRPETVESLFVMYRATHDSKYREAGWRIFQAIEKHCKVAGGGYAGLKSVKSAQPPKEDRMESFFLAETLKYLYLLFSDGRLVPLVGDDAWVFNTECHPVKTFTF